MITAPYNFVPLNNEVFYPSWTKDVNQDVPFEDSESAMIDITITSKSPIFIRNHYVNGDDYYEVKKDKKIIRVSKEFCHMKLSDGSKQYYVPGSSLKGMIRNIMEIMSFSAIVIDKDKHKNSLSVRDMTEDKETGNIFTSPMVEIANGIGLLKFKKDGTAVYTDYSIQVKNQYGQIKSHIRKIKYDQLPQSFNRKETFQKKYAVIPPYSKMTVKSLLNPDRSRRYLAEKSSTGVETMVVCNSYIDGKEDGKKYEFVLCDSDKGKSIDFGINENELKILKNFQDVYFSGGNSGTDELGQFWKEKLFTEDGKKYGIPVFVKKTNKGKIKAIGLTQIFRVAYNKNILQAAKQNTDETKLDFSETIFGSETAEKTLKGRVFFSHFKSKIVRYEKPSKTVEQVLGTPNPSYYPNYIRQTNVNGDTINKYKTLMDDNAQISGWKQYPLQNKIQHYALPKNVEEKVNHEVTTEFIPLESDTVFSGKVRFHNLKKAEIGALISALTFHKNGDGFLHNIGMAKALGYGKIKIKLTTFEGFKYSEEEYLQSFEDVMNHWEDKEYVDWKDSLQVKELFSMHDNRKAVSLEYQKLENSKGNNDFTEAKKSKKYLLSHSGVSTKSTAILKPKTMHTSSGTISKTKIRKALMAYWKKEYGIQYHRNQIQEFLSKDGFSTTPEEQRTIYEKERDNESFIKFCKLILLLEFGDLSDAYKESLYKKLVE